LKNSGGSVIDFPGGEKAGTEAIVDIPCDIWIPAARPDVLNKTNAGRLKARIVAQGANIPCTPEAEAILESRGILILPDFVVNAGGVICAAIEYHGGSESTAFGAIDDKIRKNTTMVIEESRRAAPGYRPGLLRPHWRPAESRTRDELGGGANEALLMVSSLL
jgi:glutamate dehydrogenase/leucine dehydrogenase